MWALLQITIMFVLLQGILGENCYTNSDKTEVTCVTTFAGERESITIKLDTCRKNPKITFNIVVEALGIDWTKEFDNSQSVPIPGLTSLGNGVYLTVEIRSEPDGKTYLKMELTVKLLIKLTSLTLMDEYIGKSDCNEFLYWWNSQSDAIKGSVSGGAGLFLILFIACCCKCCCCKKKEQAGTTFVMAPPTTSPGNIIVQNSTQQQQQTYFPPNNMLPMGNNPYINNHHDFDYKKLNNEI